MSVRGITAYSINAMGDLTEISEMFAHAATGFAVTDLGGRVVSANKAMGEIVDLTDEELQAVNLFELTHPGDQTKHRNMLEKLLRDEIPAFVIEKRYVLPDGNPVWVRNSVTIINKNESSGPHLIHTCEDLSDRKRAESILKNQEQMAAIGRLTSSIVHEINNPLEAIFNLMYLAQHSADLQEAKLHVRQAQEELERISEITSQSLQFHRQPLAATSASVVGLLETVLTLFKARFRAAGVLVNLTYQNSPEVMCFAGEMRQVFVNLLDNAVEAMQGRGELRLRVRPATDWRTGEPGVRVTIADTGSGISEETRSRIYEAFFTTKGDRGSGLGLWVTASIVRKHNGHIHVRSRCTHNSGTVFSLVFPFRGAAGKASGFQDAA